MYNEEKNPDFLKDILKEFQSNMNNNDVLGIENGVNMTLVLYGLARGIKDKVSGYLNDEGYVEIAKVLDFCGVDMQECHLNSEQDFFDSEISGYLDANEYSQNTHGWKIYINKDISGLERRYVMAHEVSHYILDYLSEKKIRRYCATPVFPKDSSEQACDMLASFLLMPLDGVLECFKNFRAEKMHEDKKPRKVEFIKYLAYSFLLTDLQAAMSFENVRHLAGVLYEKSVYYEFEKNKNSQELGFLSMFEQEFELIKNYKECFR